MFSSTLVDTFPVGNKRMSVGTWTQDAGDNGGTIDTGLSSVDWFYAFENGGNGKVTGFNTSLSSNNIVVATGQVNIGLSGVWQAIGH